MTNLPLFPESDPTSNDTPLPLEVAKRWQFPLAFHIVEGKHYYSIQDWLRGLYGDHNTRSIMSNFKKSKHETTLSKRSLPYKAADGKTYKRDHTTDEGLYLLAQYLRATSTTDRPVLDEIKAFLASAGAFVDKVRLDPQTVLTSGAISPDDALDAVIQMYRDQGKSDEWIQARMDSKIKRNEFVLALKKAVVNINPRIYALATNEIYLGLWDRTADDLRTEMKLSKHASLRDHQPMMGLEYQRIAEGVCAKKLGDKQELTGAEACAIIRIIATIIGRQAQETSELMQMDLATGHPLPQLPHG